MKIHVNMAEPAPVQGSAQNVGQALGGPSVTDTSDESDDFDSSLPIGDAGNMVLTLLYKHRF